MSRRGRRGALTAGIALVLTALTVSTSCSASQGGEDTEPVAVREDLAYSWPARGDLAGDRDFVTAAAERLDDPKPHLLWAGTDVHPDSAGRSIALFVADSPKSKSGADIQMAHLLQEVTRDRDGRWSTDVGEPFGDEHAAIRIPAGLAKGWAEGAERQFLLLRHKVGLVYPVTPAIDETCPIVDGVAVCPEGLLAFGEGSPDEYAHPALSDPLRRWSGTAEQLGSLVDAVRYTGDQPVTTAVTDARGRLLLGPGQHLYTVTLSLGNHVLGRFRLPDGRGGVLVFIRIVAVTDDGSIEPGAWTLAWVPDDGSPAVFGENSQGSAPDGGRGIAAAIPRALWRPLIMATAEHDRTLRTRPRLPVVGNEIIAERGAKPATGYRVTVFAGAAPVTVEYVDSAGKVAFTKRIETAR
ncbi:hypothetical protein [Actinophytocola sp.]|uniref:hypothetical protein n=1 Tax=Actinophytocola sp. TaxID=1872138 RepID=UPI003D6B09C8